MRALPARRPAERRRGRPVSGGHPRKPSPPLQAYTHVPLRAAFVFAAGPKRGSAGVGRTSWGWSGAARSEMAESSERRGSAVVLWATPYTLHPAPGTPLPPEVTTPRLPPASPLFSAALCTSSCRPAASCKTREFGGFLASHLRPFFLYLSGQLQGVFQGCGLLCCLLLPPAAAACCFRVSSAD